uniref:Amino acid transporter transmembrane domain-containing protein n=1 Tax=Leersia perrieri TaxID=77586 RepID=A0A0D9XXP3_9ORYZ
MVMIEPLEVSLEAGNASDSAALDDDGRPRRTGTTCTATAHIVTAVIGSGVLSLPWATAQLGWIAGPAVMAVFGAVTYYTSTLQAECYRTGDAETGRRNYTYIEAVRSILGGAKVKLCGVIQYANLIGVAIGYTIAASISMNAIRRAGCFHVSGHNVPCHSSSNMFMIVFGVVEIVFSQIPDFNEIWWLSIVAAVMSFTYSGIGLGLGIAQTVANGGFAGTIAGVANVTVAQKVWRSLQALGNIAFAFAFSNVLTEIQDTIKAPPPSEAAVMKKATAASVAATSAFYAACGWMGYAAFGNAAPDNLLTGFGFYEPYWLVDVANAAIAVHLVGAYQVFVQPVFAFVERSASRRWPDSAIINRELRVGPFAVSAFRLAWRTAFVCLTTVVAMSLPFFGVVVGLLGSISFWPLTVYLPTEMYIKQRDVRRGSARWIGLKLLAGAGLVVSVAATVGSVAGFVGQFKNFRPFSG